MITIQFCNEEDILLGFSINPVDSYDGIEQTLIGIGFLFFVIYIII